MFPRNLQHPLLRKYGNIQSPMERPCHETNNLKINFVPGY